MICVAVSEVTQEVLLQHHHDELHRRVVVVEHDDLVQLGRLDALLLLFGDDRALAVLATGQHRA